MARHVLMVLSCMLVYTVTIIYSYQMGRDSAFDDLILEKCWLNNQTRDIECITRITD
jgi:hypothetical protein